MYLLSLSPVVQEKNRPKQPRGVSPLYFDIQYAMQDALFGQFDIHKWRCLSMVSQSLSF